MGCHPSHWRTHLFQDGHIAPPTRSHTDVWLVVWNMAFMTFHMPVLGMSSSQLTNLTNSMIFQRGEVTTNQSRWDPIQERPTKNIDASGRRRDRFRDLCSTDLSSGCREGWLSELEMFDITLWLCQNSYWKWPFIVEFPIKNGDFP